MKADLHNHTTASDGVLTPLELAKYAKNKNIDIIAITDHDSVDAFNYSIESPIPIIKGVELSTYCKNENIHLLGYFKNNEIPEEIRIILKHFQEKRKDRVKLMIKKLKEHFNIIIEYKDIEKYTSIEGTIGRPHVAKAIEEKYNISFKEIFDRFIGNDLPAYVPTENLGLKEAIELLHKNNAIAVLAHPFLIKKNDINTLISLGIDGIEVNYAKHTINERKYFRNIAKKHNLIITGGSDFHKHKVKEDDVEIGDGNISDKELEIFLKALNINIEE